MENVKCNEVAGVMYAFPRIPLPKKAVEAATVSSLISGLDFQNRSGSQPCYANRPKQGNPYSGILGFGLGIKLQEVRNLANDLEFEIHVALTGNPKSSTIQSVRACCQRIKIK